jgi:eukaryotic-like serine/threonine-protein kinase
VSMRRRARPRAGDRIGAVLTVVGAIVDRGDEPVYIVWNHEAWCPMACKLFKSIERAQRELEIMTALAHPGIIRPLGLGDHPPHLLMEFLEGPRLGAMVETHPRGCLNLSDALRIAIYLGAALAHMHARELLHLDVKPSNVIVTTAGRPVLLDLGSARRRADWGVSRIDGTDDYMAPEQCVADAPVGPATDVFSLGVTLYQLLTGKLPFALSSKERPFPQLQDDPVPARRHRPTLPAGLDRLLLRCLARDPTERPGSWDELLPQLHGFIRSGPLMWPEDFRPERPSGNTAAAALAM